MSSPNPTVTYGNGESKKGSVRMKPIASTHDITVVNLGDIYVSREIMNALGLKDSDSIEVTFSNPKNPLI